MMKIFLRRPALVEETPLSRFVLHASSSEKRRVYNHIIREAAKEQHELMIKASRDRDVSRERVHA